MNTAPTYISISTLPTPAARPVDRFLHEVAERVDTRMARVRAAVPQPKALHGVVSGKKLRARLVGYLAEARVPGLDRRSAVAACAATELVHSASLCHDDIIDEADLRRGRPTMWRRVGIPGAILVGDLLLVESFGALADECQPEAIADFVDTLAWVARAEMDQELAHRGVRGDARRWRDVCEGKTGALFAFPARWACPHDPLLAVALGRAALCIGTAYQMYDDLLDIAGDEREAGKTLGQDASRGKHTIPASPGREHEVASAAIEGALAEALELVEAWPRAQGALERFITRELRLCVRATEGRTA